jgi:WD40 repeat protein
MTGRLPQHDEDPDPGRIATQQDFGRELTLARRRAGLTVRGVARAAGLPPSTVGDYFSGRHLPPPSQPRLLPAILRACGETDPERVRAWTAALTNARRAPGRRAAGARPPYLGLASFQRADAPLFFGREEITDRLVDLAAGAAGPGAGTEGVPLAVVGPSGSGKSSLLRAGLVPRLLAGSPPGQRVAQDKGQAGPRPVALFTPSRSPLAELAARLSRLTAAAPQPAGGDIEDPLSRDPAQAGQLDLGSAAGSPLIVVDQFEAIFTDCQDESERQAFITAVCALSGPAIVVVALRADFYDRALRYPALARALQERQIVLGPMSAAQVRRAIVEPARLARLDVADGLVEVLLRDLAPSHATGHPAASARSDSARSDSARSDSARSDSARSDSARSDSARSDSARSDSARSDSARSDSARSDSARSDSARSDSARSDSARSDSARSDSARSGDGDIRAHEPGALPLLSHALLATWEHSHGGRLTVADYQATGGISQAIARTAETVYENLDAGQQETARRLFLRLVNAASDMPETRSVVQLGELDNQPRDGSATAVVLARFVNERLITTDAGTAQITHDALLTAWPRLRAWIDAGRDNLRIRRRVSDAAQAWAETDRDSAALLRGRQLAVAADWAAEPGNSESLGPLAREFLISSADQEQARGLAERNRTRRLHRLVAALTMLVLVTCGLAGYAFRQRAAANLARDSATVATDAESRAVAVEANQVRVRNVTLAAQLSLAAFRIAPTSGARASVLESSGTPAAARLIDSHLGVEAVRLSPDRRVLAAAAADGTLRLWDVSSMRRLVLLGPALAGKSGNALYTVAFSPDGTMLAAAGASGKVALWNLRDLRHPVRLGALTGPAGTIYSVAFSPDGTMLAAGSADDTVRLWNLATPGRATPLAPLTGPAGFVESVAFSPDGRWLAAGCADHTVRLWNVAGPDRPGPAGKPLTGPADVVYSVAFSPDGRMLAAAGKDDKIWLWDTARPASAVRSGAPLTGATDWINAVAFSPDGRSIAAASNDNAVRIWGLASRSVTAELPHPGPVTALAWSGAGRLVTADADGMARIWALPTPVLLAGGGVTSVAYGHDRALLAVGGHDLQLWNPLTRQRLAAATVPGTGVSAVAFAPGDDLIAAGYGNGTMQLWRPAVPLARIGPAIRASADRSGPVESVAFSPDGRLLGTGAADGTVRLWDVSAPASPRLLASRRDSGTYVFSVAFSPDGRTLAAASADDLTRLWGIADPARPALLGAPLGGPASNAVAVAFSPDGKTLAVGSADKTVWLWNVTDPARSVLLGRPLTGPAGFVYSVAFSPDGTMLAAGVTDGTVWLWNVRPPARPALLAALTGPTARVNSVAFGPGGHTVAAGSADGTVRLWDTSAAAAAQAVCASAGQPLTRLEWASFVPGLSYRPPCPAG